MHAEHHKSHRAGWLRAAVLGANDGIVSTASLLIGVASAGSSREMILLSGISGLVAGAMSMAAGEYVSVSSQADTEKADLALEQAHLLSDPEMELGELAEIYVARGLAPALALEVAQQLMAKDALGAHARDEIGITAELAARPVQAAWSSAATFTAGAALPVAVAALVPDSAMTMAISASSLVFLALLGGIAARAGGASIAKGAVRVTIWGTLAMVATALVGKAVGVSVS